MHIQSIIAYRIQSKYKNFKKRSIKIRYLYQVCFNAQSDMRILKLVFSPAKQLSYTPFQLTFHSMWMDGCMFYLLLQHYNIHTEDRIQMICVKMKGKVHLCNVCEIFNYIF